MNLFSHFDKYLDRYSEYGRYPLYGGEMSAYDQIVVIPCLAEKESLFNTLAGLTRNESEELDKTLVLCVINNRLPPFATADDIRNNGETMEIMKALIKGEKPKRHPAGTDIGLPVDEILSSPLRLAFIDASSPGRELPRKGGVGQARKIGMDRALTLLDPRRLAEKTIYCLDADTLVEPNYLVSLRAHYARFRPPGAVVDFAHPIPGDPLLAAGICRYEIFLRYYVLGLEWAGSPYAFHTIGSTMTCTAASYLAVRGMPCRQAGEDFYFLNKLAKIAPLGSIRDTTVYPSARPSGRVPFGTGRRMQRFLAGADDGYLVYDPEVFAVLKAWIEEFARDPDRPGRDLLAGAAAISSLLCSFLEHYEFVSLWERIRGANRRRDYLTRQFHGWFDGFRTLKLIHALSADAFPPQPMFRALTDLFRRMRVPCPRVFAGGECRGLDGQLSVLDLLRRGNFNDR